MELTRSGGLSVMVDNKPGAGGTLATREMLLTPPDGYTLRVANVGVLAVVLRITPRTFVSKVAA